MSDPFSSVWIFDSSSFLYSTTSLIQWCSCLETDQHVSSGPMDLLHRVFLAKLDSIREPSSYFEASKDSK
ncbi:hypothetical protein M569_12117 [Genlisea aurea]|uniref:Uncharacterized protein n=1 Tax=Genlisea aurea TaxID=192259 RepID=S8DS78_9LAMI|nr:hypothetical protein M569_12117 [Genlisea aurea]